MLNIKISFLNNKILENNIILNEIIKLNEFINNKIIKFQIQKNKLN